jgi:hypothetical protein
LATSAARTRRISKVVPRRNSAPVVSRSAYIGHRYRSLGGRFDRVQDTPWRSC